MSKFARTASVLISLTIILPFTIGLALAGDYEIQQPRGKWQVPGEFQKPTGPWQVPGEIQKPTGPWQQPEALQTVPIPTGKAAITEKTEPCKHYVLICADTLFEFNKSTLSPNAEAALKLVAAKIKALGEHPLSIEGHTDAIGSDEYNQQLSQVRAERVKNWLLSNHFIGPEAQIVGFGKKKPIAPNQKPDKSDNPKGRQLNRRVEIVVDTCRTLDASNPSAAATTGLPNSTTDTTFGAAQSKNTDTGSSDQAIGK